MRDRTYNLPHLSNCVPHSRYQEEWTPSPRTTFGPGTIWSLWLARRLFHVRMDRSSRDPLDRPFDWCHHLGHFDLPHPPVRLRLPAALLSEIRGISLRSQRSVSIYVRRGVYHVFETNVHQPWDRWRSQPSSWTGLCRCGWNVRPLALRRRAQIKEYFRGELYWMI